METKDKIAKILSDQMTEDVAEIFQEFINSGTASGSDLHQMGANLVMFGTDMMTNAFHINALHGLVLSNDEKGLKRLLASLEEESVNSPLN